MIYVLLILILLLLIGEALYDATEGDSHDIWSDLLLFLILLNAQLAGLALGTFAGAIYYVMIRFSIFDYLYNLFKGRAWSYLGKLSDTDNFFRRLNPYALLMARAVVLCSTLIIIFCYETRFSNLVFDYCSRAFRLLGLA